MSYIKFFDEISKEDTKIAGGKGASLGEMVGVGIPVPPGFVVTVDAFKSFSGSDLSKEFEEEILQAFDKLWQSLFKGTPCSGKECPCEKRVAVRSSAVAEDSTKASWAGQLETYLNVGRDELVESIQKCWRSIKSERALSYAADKNLSERDLAVAVVVQKMVESEVSGVMFTVNPVTEDPDELMIEATFGLGELLVQGEITPDNFLVRKYDLKVLSADIQVKERKLIFQDGQNAEVELSESEGGKRTLGDEQVKELAQLGIKIEQHYGSPQDIEWALGKGKIYILQSRPITTLS